MRGYQILNWLKADYGEKRQAGAFNAAVDHQNYTDVVNEWGRDVIFAYSLIRSSQQSLKPINSYTRPIHSGQSLLTPRTTTKQAVCAFALMIYSRGWDDPPKE